MPAPEPVREAGVRFVELAHRYTALRRLQELYSRWSPTQRCNGEFMEMRNRRELAPNAAVLFPFPEDPTRRLKYLLDRGADLWMPTQAERDALFDERRPTRSRAVSGVPRSVSG